MSDNKDDTKQEKNIEKLYNSLLGGQFSSVTLRSTDNIPSDSVGKGFKNTQTESPQHSVQSSVKTPVETPVKTPSQPPTQAPQNTPAPQKTLQDIEQDIADANFDISDINTFGDHNTPEVDSIGDISTTAQAVLDKIQQKVDDTKSDISASRPQQPRQDTFVTQNADKFAEALYAHNTGDSQNTSQPSTAHLDFDFDSLPPPQSPVQQSLMSSLLNLTIFLIVTVGLLGGGYYWYTSSIKIDSTAPVILQATLPIKVPPPTPGGMKIENLDKDVYGVLDDNNALSDQVERLRPLPEQPIQLPKPKNNAPSSDTKSPSPPLFENTKKTLANDGTVVEQLSIAPPPNKPVQKNPVTIPTVKPQETNTTETQAESMASVGQKNLIKPTQKPTQDTKNTDAQKSVQSEAKKPTDSPSPENLVQKKSESAPNIQAVQPTKNTDTQKSIQSEAKKPTDSPTPENLVQKKSESVPNIQVVQPTKNIGWRVQLAALTNAPDAFKTHKVMLNKFKFLQDKPFHVELATVKGKKYYRLQIINFTDKQQAMALCSQIKNAGGDCILKK